VRRWAAISLLDGLLWLPPLFASFFFTSTLYRGGTWDDAVENTLQGVPPAIQFSLCFWPPMHLLTFFVVPVAQRVLFVNVASIAIAFALSYISGQEATNSSTATRGEAAVPKS
jgi:hypothetical protein